MAKKTSYLTELIERHDRWKADVGGRKEEPDDDRRRRDEYVELPPTVLQFLTPLTVTMKRT